MDFVNRFKGLFHKNEERLKKKHLTLSMVNTDVNPEDNWQIIKELAAGSEGQVVKALRKSDGMNAAAKIIRVDDENQFCNYMTEVDILCVCDHANIVRLYETYYFDDKIWVFEEFCELGGLDAIMAKLDHALDEMEIQFVAKNLLNAICYLHKNLIIHRDIKAGNVMITKDGLVKLGDFGVAARIKSESERRYSFIGSSYWMAPEVIVCETNKTEGYDFAADIWSFGVTLIELAEMNPPHYEMNQSRVLVRILKHPSPTLGNCRAWSHEFNTFLLHCLAKSPRERLSADDLLKEPFIRSMSSSTSLDRILREFAADVIVEVIHEVPSNKDLVIEESKQKQNGFWVTPIEAAKSKNEWIESDTDSDAEDEGVIIVESNDIENISKEGNDEEEEKPSSSVMLKNVRILEDDNFGTNEPIESKNDDLSVPYSHSTTELHNSCSQSNAVVTGRTSLLLSNDEMSRVNGRTESENDTKHVDVTSAKVTADVDLMNDNIASLSIFDSPKSVKMRGASVQSTPVNVYDVEVADFRSSVVTSSEMSMFETDIDRKASFGNPSASFQTFADSTLLESCKEKMDKSIDASDFSNSRQRKNSKLIPAVIESTSFSSFNLDILCSSLLSQLIDEVLCSDHFAPSVPEVIFMVLDEFHCPDLYNPVFVNPVYDSFCDGKSPEDSYYEKNKLYPLENAKRDLYTNHSHRGNSKNESYEIQRVRQKTIKTIRTWIDSNGQRRQSISTRYVTDDDEENFANISSQHRLMQRKEESRNFRKMYQLQGKRLEQLKERQLAELKAKEEETSIEREKLVEKFNEEQNYLHQEQKQEMQRAEEIMANEIRNETKRKTADNEKCMKRFKDKQREEMRSLKKNNATKEDLIQLENLHKRKEEQYKQRQLNELETYINNVKSYHMEKLASLDNTFTQKRHQFKQEHMLLMCDFEEKQLCEKYQLLCNHVKEFYSIVREFILANQQKELEELDEANRLERESLIAEMNLKKRNFVKYMKDVSKTRAKQCRRNLIMQGNDSPNGRERIRDFSEAEQNRLRLELHRQEEELRRKINRLFVAHQQRKEELLKIQHQRRTKCSEKEAHKLSEIQNSYAEELGEFRRTLEQRKNKMTEELNKEMEEKNRFYACSNGFDLSRSQNVGTKIYIGADCSQISGICNKSQHF